MKISEIITDKYKLRIPPTVYYELLADVQEVEEEQEPTTKIDCNKTDCNKCVNHKYCDYEPTTKNDLGVDCISRAEAIKCLECDFDITGKENMKTVVNYINSAHDKIVNLPRVKQEPETGHWINRGKQGEVLPFYMRYECSMCGETADKSNYCPHCGAKMAETEANNGEIDSIPDLSVFEQEDFGTPDMIRLIENAPTVQAIPKADYEASLKKNNELVNDLEELRTMINKFAESYENRLKADMVAMLTELQLEIEELDTPSNSDAYITCSDIIQQKINALKAETEDQE